MTGPQLIELPDRVRTDLSACSSRERGGRWRKVRPCIGRSISAHVSAARRRRRPARDLSSVTPGRGEANVSTRVLIEEILSQRRFAVVGASRDRDKFGYKVFRALKVAGYAVYPVNPNAELIDS